MYFILFTLYLILACFLITRTSFIKNAALGNKLIIALFLLKVVAGLMIGWMSQKFYPQGSDYWGLNEAGIREYHLLVADPKKFFTEIFISPYQNGYDGFFNSVGSYWNDLKNTLVGKLLAGCNIYSRGNYYINSLFLNFIGFFGHVALYRIFTDIYYNKKWPLIIGCFLLPSTLYFSAGIHKDLIVWTSLSFYCYALYFSTKNKLTIKYVLILLLSFIVLLFIRNFVAIALIPATVGFIISKRSGVHSAITFAAVYGIGFIGLFFASMINPNFQPLKIITQKQQDFIDLPVASSQVDIQVLKPTLASFIHNAPQALNHAFLRPYIWESPTKFLIPLALELFLYELLFILSIVFWQKINRPIDPFILLGLFLVFSMLLFTGYIVPNIGSIVRYRSLYLPFLLTPILCHINFKKFSV